MLRGLQTHFNSRVDMDTLHQLKTFGFEIVRIDAMECYVEEMHLMIADVAEAGLKPLVIVQSEDKLNALPEGIDVEWTNEPDGDILPSRYYPSFASACKLALSRGLKLWAPAISNLDEDSLKWLNDLRVAGKGWPEGMFGVSAHRYGDGTFEQPHAGFSSRASEAKWLKAACQGKPFIITEVGYPTVDHLTDSHQRESLQKEFDFWTVEGCQQLYIYQLNDGHDDSEKYGIRRTDGSWKESAYLFTTPPEDITGGDIMADHKAVPGVRKAHLISLGGNKYAARYPSNADTVLSIQPNGDWDTRPNTEIGAWETAELIDNALAYESDGRTWFVPVR